MEPILIPLLFPFKHRGKSYTEIRILRRARAKDLIAGDRQPGPEGREAALLTAVSDFDFATVGEMDALDYNTAKQRARISFCRESFWGLGERGRGDGKSHRRQLGLAAGNGVVLRAAPVCGPVSTALRAGEGVRRLRRARARSSHSDEACGSSAGRCAGP